MSQAIKAGIAFFIQTATSQIDDAQTAFNEDPLSTNPTHSQLAKDHGDHPLHLLACELASGASKDVGIAIQQAWSGANSADEVVATASQYIVHPAHILAGRSSAWVLQTIDSWARSHSAAIKDLGARSWSLEWSKRQSQNLKELQRKANELSGSSPPEQERILNLLIRIHAPCETAFESIYCMQRMHFVKVMLWRC